MTVQKEKAKENAALYYEICLLRLLCKMGYLDAKALNGIIRIASEDYGTQLVTDPDFLCPK